MSDENQEYIRIGHHDDAVALLEEMVAHTKEIVSIHADYYQPRLEALLDAVERWIV